MKSIKFLALLLIIIPILFSCESTTDNNTVATPVFAPAGGTYTTAQTVTITSATDGATIYYTMDGTNPTNTSMMYAGPINVASDMTIKAIAMKDTYNDSPIATANYMVYLDMVMVPAGTFTMGSAPAVGDPDEHPSHAVTLTNGFYMAMHELTQAEWLDIMPSNPSEHVGNSYPVEMVCWYDVLVYCNMRSMDEGLTPAYTIDGSTNPTDWGAVPAVPTVAWDEAICNWNANGYRMPTEAEWEHAAKANTSLIYSGSDTVGDVAWYDGNATTSKTVETKAANALGLYDMSGNVQEWVWDWYGNNYYGGAITDPHGPNNSTSIPPHRVIRGGSFDQTDYAARVAFRNHGTPEQALPGKVINNRIGIRLVRTAN